MASAQATRDTLHRIVDGMKKEEAEALLDYLNMLADPDTLEPEELEEVTRILAEMDAGESVSLEELTKTLGE